MDIEIEHDKRDQQRHQVGTPKIEFHDVHKSFGTKSVLQGVNVKIYEKQSFVIIGASGSGKSVMLKCILTLVHPDKGAILIDGHNVETPQGSAEVAARKDIGVLFQGGALFDSMCVWENVAFGLMHVRKMPRKRAKDIAIKKLEQVHLTPDIGDVYPADLSGGMRKRVALARAIATEPHTILFDEPTTGLDPIMSETINHLITECVHDLGVTTVTITHDMTSCLHMADQIAMLHEGTIVWQGDRKALLTASHPQVRRFIEASAVLDKYRGVYT